MNDIYEIITAAWREIRRWYYFNFDMDYVNESISKRKGRCSNHGCCSQVPKIIRCKFANEGGCEIWKNQRQKKLPLRCQLYPFDEKDKASFTKSYCSFYWDVKKEETQSYTDYGGERGLRPHSFLTNLSYALGG